jgi:hypothetical protein
VDHLKKLKSTNSEGSSGGSLSSPKTTVETPTGEVTQIIEKKRTSTLRTIENETNPEVSSYCNSVNSFHFSDFQG